MTGPGGLTIAGLGSCAVRSLLLPQARPGAGPQGVPRRRLRVPLAPFAAEGRCSLTCSLSQPRWVQIALAGASALIVRFGVVLVAALGRSSASGKQQRAAGLNEMTQPGARLTTGAFVAMLTTTAGDRSNGERQGVRDPQRLPSST